MEKNLHCIRESKGSLFFILQITMLFVTPMFLIILVFFPKTNKTLTAFTNYEIENSTCCIIDLNPYRTEICNESVQC